MLPARQGGVSLELENHPLDDQLPSTLRALPALSRMAVELSDLIRYCTETCLRGKCRGMEGPTLYSMSFANRRLQGVLNGHDYLE